MPVAIVVRNDGTIPVIFSEETDAQLVARLESLAGSPAIPSISSARLWPSGLPEPSGLFETVEDARAHVARTRRPCEMNGGKQREIRDAVGMSRADFGAALGFGGNDNTRHKQVFEMELGAKPIMPERARAARALGAEHALEAS